MTRADWTIIASQPPCVSRHGAQQQAAPSRLLSEESSLNGPLLLILVKLLDRSRQIPDSIHSCSLSQVPYCERLVIEIQSLRNQITDRLKAIQEAREAKKRFLKMTFRFDQVARKLDKVVELSFGRAAEAQRDLEGGEERLVQLSR